MTYSYRVTWRVPGNDVIVLWFSTEVKADIITDAVIMFSRVVHDG